MRKTSLAFGVCLACLVSNLYGVYPLEQSRLNALSDDSYLWHDAQYGARFEYAWDITEGEGSTVFIAETKDTSYNNVFSLDLLDASLVEAASNPADIVLSNHTTHAAYVARAVGGIRDPLNPTPGIGELAGVSLKSHLILYKQANFAPLYLNDYAMLRRVTATNSSYGTYENKAVSSANDATKIRTYGRGGKGALPIAGSGNENTSDLFYPASGNGFVSVGAGYYSKDSNGLPKVRREYFSNYGDTLDLVSEERSGTGTSFASPVVAGIVALINSVNPELSADEMEMILLKSADKGYMANAVPSFNTSLLMEKFSGQWDAYRISPPMVTKEGSSEPEPDFSVISPLMDYLKNLYYWDENGKNYYVGHGVANANEAVISTKMHKEFKNGVITLEEGWNFLGGLALERLETIFEHVVVFKDGKYRSSLLGDTNLSIGASEGFWVYSSSAVPLSSKFDYSLQAFLDGKYKQPHVPAAIVDAFKRIGDIAQPTVYSYTTTMLSEDLIASLKTLGIQHSFVPTGKRTASGNEEVSLSLSYVSPWAPTSPFEFKGSDYGIHALDINNSFLVLGYDNKKKTWCFSQNEIITEDLIAAKSGIARCPKINSFSGYITLRPKDDVDPQRLYDITPPDALLTAVSQAGLPSFPSLRVEEGTSDDTQVIHISEKVLVGSAKSAREQETGLFAWEIKEGWNLIGMAGRVRLDKVNEYGLAELNLAPSNIQQYIPGASITWRYYTYAWFTGWGASSPDPEMQARIAEAVAKGSILSDWANIDPNGEGAWVYSKTDSAIKIKAEAFHLVEGQKGEITYQMERSPNMWHMLAVHKNIRIADLHAHYSHPIKLLWTFEDGAWKVYAPGLSAQEKNALKGFETITHLKRAQGFWVMFSE